MMTMLILRGIAGFYAGRNWPRGALYEDAALEYASRRGYQGRVLDVAGWTGPGSAQTKLTLEEFRRDQTVAALYGFSGGGYNILHVVNQLKRPERDRLHLLVVIGSPKNSADKYRGPWEVVYVRDPPSGHMEGPRVLLAQTPKPAPQRSGRRDLASGMPTGQ